MVKPEDADFVYIPHCSMNVYLAWKDWRYKQMIRSVAGTGSHAGTLPFEWAGVLHSGVLKDVDRTYLIDVARIAFASAAVQTCLARAPRCRLLVVNAIFGRDELPWFDNALGREAVFLTTAGASPRFRLSKNKTNQPGMV